VAEDLEIVSRVRGGTEAETGRQDSAQGRQDARGSVKVKDASNVSVTLSLKLNSLKLQEKKIRESSQDGIVKTENVKSSDKVEKCSSA